METILKEIIQTMVTFDEAAQLCLTVLGKHKSRGSVRKELGIQTQSIFGYTLIPDTLYDALVLCLEVSLENINCTCEPYYDAEITIHDKEKCWLMMKDQIEQTLKELKKCKDDNS